MGNNRSERSGYYENPQIQKYNEVQAQKPLICPHGGRGCHAGNRHRIICCSLFHSVVVQGCRCEYKSLSDLKGTFYYRSSQRFFQFFRFFRNKPPPAIDLNTRNTGVLAIVSHSRHGPQVRHPQETSAGCLCGSLSPVSLPPSGNCPALAGRR